MLVKIFDVYILKPEIVNINYTKEFLRGVSSVKNLLLKV